MKAKKQWYRVVFENCFYDDMVGYVVSIQDRSITLSFTGAEQVTFYKDQVRYADEF